MSANDPNRSSASRLIVTDPRNSVLRASRATGDDSTGSCQSLTQPLRREDMSRNAFGTFICALCCLLFARAAWADGAVYAMTNALGNNEIKAFHRAANGSLSLAQTIATGGGGGVLQLAGVDVLGSSGSLQLDRDHRFLFAVNTESASENNGAGAYNTDCQQGTITSFRVEADGTLTFADRVFSGGLFP